MKQIVNYFDMKAASRMTRNSDGKSVLNEGYLYMDEFLKEVNTEELWLEELTKRTDQEEKNNEHERKVKICSYFLAGNCKFWERCKFSHEKTQSPCKFFTDSQNCKNGENCKFAHILPASFEQKLNIFCIYITITALEFQWFSLVKTKYIIRILFIYNYVLLLI